MTVCTGMEGGQMTEGSPPKRLCDLGFRTPSPHPAVTVSVSFTTQQPQPSTQLPAAPGTHDFSDSA